MSRARTTAATAAVTFNSDRAAIDHLQTAAHGRRAARRGPATLARDLLGAITDRAPGRRAHTPTGDKAVIR